MAADTGGPAFPRPHSNDHTTEVCNISCEQEGMTLLDYFAAAALANLAFAEVRHGMGYCPRVAEFAYDVAEAMMKRKFDLEQDSS